MDLLRKILTFLAFFFVVGILFSFLFPGKVKIVDDIRLFMQRPVIMWLGKLKADELPGEVDIDYIEIAEYLEELPVGSIYFTSTRGYVITEFIPGKWKHAGIFLGTKKKVARTFGRESSLYRRLDTLMHDDVYYVLDSRAEGVLVHPMVDLSNMREISYLTDFAVFSPNMSLEELEIFILEALNYLYREYDFDWLMGDDESVFCSELVYIALKRVGLDVALRTYTLGREVVSPDDLYDFFSQNSTDKNSFVFYMGLSKNSGILEIILKT